MCKLLGSKYVHTSNYKNKNNNKIRRRYGDLRGFVEKTCIHSRTRSVSLAQIRIYKLQEKPIIGPKNWAKRDTNAEPQKQFSFQRQPRGGTCALGLPQATRLRDPGNYQTPHTQHKLPVMIRDSIVHKCKAKVILVQQERSV